MPKPSLETAIMGASKVVETIATSIVILFCVIIWSVVDLFRYLNLKVDMLSSPFIDLPSANLISVHLESFRRQHTLMCRLVDEIQSFFGLILLFALAHSFISLITDSFEVAMAFKRSDYHLPITFIFFSGHHLIVFSLICFGCDLLQSEVQFEYYIA